MRNLDIGDQGFTEVHVLDEPGEGGACHEYMVTQIDKSKPLTAISFQCGPIQENGVNGCGQEDLMAIVIDRLRSFQAGEFACRENALALTKFEEGLHWLNHRTRERQSRGVEGTNKL